MKVNITLTVAGNDVTIDYTEGRIIFEELRSLYEPRTQSAFENFSTVDYGIDSDGSKKSNPALAPAPAPGCGTTGTMNVPAPPTVSDEVATAIKDIEEMSEPEFIDQPKDALIDDAIIDTEESDAEIAERMKQMQSIIDGMNKK